MKPKGQEILLFECCLCKCKVIGKQNALRTEVGENLFRAQENLARLRKARKIFPWKFFASSPVEFYCPYLFMLVEKLE